MRLSIVGDIGQLEEGIRLVKEDLGLEWDQEGLPVDILHREGPIEVAFEKGRGRIAYDRRIHFFRALGLFMENIRKGTEFNIVEIPRFDTNGVMIDCSRNSVMKVESVRLILRKMALMGLNMLMLYTENTYEVKDYPYFGYMQGRYSYEELKECDDYADALGIEMVPCIQTLAHLTQALKWSYAGDIMDTPDILLVGEEKTYCFIEAMIKAASAPFRSKRIHIGMDEAHSVGLGRYLDLHGYRRRFDVLCEHMEKVADIVSRCGLEPMIWSDMYFKFASKTADYYDTGAEVPDDVAEKTPKNLRMVFWDYFVWKEEKYRANIAKHRKFGRNPVFATCVWTWQGFCTNYGLTFANINGALAACKKEGVREVFTTVWFNNGGETNVFCTLLGMQLHAEHGYADSVELEKLAQRFEVCTGGSLEAFMDLKLLDEIPGTSKDNLTCSAGEMSPANPSKYILWQDPLVSLFDRHLEEPDIAGHYSRLEVSMKRHAESGGEWEFVFDVPQKLCAVLSKKTELAQKLQSAYLKGERQVLAELAEKLLPELHERVEALRTAHRSQWFRTYKPFGWEVIDGRYGGLEARIQSAMTRLEDYLEGRVAKLEELEEERLFFDGPVRNDNIQACVCWQHARIATAGSMDV